jgi:hypothetical protein
LSIAVIESDAWESIEKVVELHLQGKSPRAIAMKLGIKVVEATNAINQWREVVNNDMESRDSARDSLNAMVARYDHLISRLNDNLDNLQSLEFDEKISAQINATLKNIGDLDKVRVDLMQKAGLLESADLGTELAEREAREEALINILRNDLCPECRLVVAEKLQSLTNVVEAKVVYE